jgi:signal transduction histidine kinase
MAPVHPVAWLRERPPVADALLAAAVAAIAVVFHLTLHMDDSAESSVLGVVLSLGATLPLAWRRRSPAVVLVVIALFQMWMEVINATGPDWMGVLVAAYTLGAYRSGRLLWRLGALAVLTVTGFVVVGVLHGDAPWQAMLSAPVVFVAAIVLGDNVRRRRERVAELAERAERAERERMLLAQQHVLDERARIARELHDVVAHSVSLMVIQAAAARRQLANDPAKAEIALATVEETGRTAMQEMRRILGVLRDDTESSSRTPQPGLAAIEALADTAPDLPVHVSFEGDVAGIPPGVELNAYRIVQEALTNVRRHAGAVQRVQVSVARNNGTLTVEVDDDGRGAAAASSPGGFGITGMRERVAAFDGRLTTGPRAGGGWRVRAVFPVDAT